MARAIAREPPALPLARDQHPGATQRAEQLARGVTAAQPLHKRGGLKRRAISKPELTCDRQHLIARLILPPDRERLRRVLVRKREADGAASVDGAAAMRLPSKRQRLLHLHERPRRALLAKTTQHAHHDLNTAEDAHGECAKGGLLLPEL